MIDYIDLIGKPFKEKGRDINTGVDCYGLVMEVYKRYGIELPEYTAQYENTEQIDKVISGEMKHKSVWQEIERSKITAPCILAIRFNVPKGIVNHTAVYIGDGKFIHAREKVGVCVERMSSPMWDRLIEGCYIYVGGKHGKISNC